MSAEELLAIAQCQGIELWLEGEQLHYRAATQVGEALKARLRNHNGEIIRILRGQAHAASEAVEVPPWCSSGCEHFDLAELPEQQAKVPGCFREDERGGWVWSRLDKMTACPFIRVELPPLPDWCSRQCPHYYAAIQGALPVERCRWQDECGRHWVRARIEQLRRCPMKLHKNRGRKR